MHITRMISPEQLPGHLRDMARRLMNYRPPWRFVERIPGTRAAFQCVWMDKEGRVSLGDMTTEPDLVDAFALLGFASSLYQVEMNA